MNDKAAVKKRIFKNYQLYILLAPTLIYFLLFKYVPMYGILIAFKDFSASLGILKSPWVGLKYFSEFINNYQFWTLLKNTLVLSVYSLVVSFPLPIIIALMLNQFTHKHMRSFIQTVIYAPHFISVVVIAGMIFLFTTPTTGLINQFITFFGGKSISFLSEPKWFSTIYVFSGVWQETGWSCIIYLAALAGIDPQLHEAAIIDGASKFQRILKIDLRGILPVVSILLILSVGGIMSVGFEKAFLLQTDLNLDASEIISTYVYKVGLQQAQYSFSTAIGLFNSIINFILLIVVNQIVKKISETSLF